MGTWNRDNAPDNVVKAAEAHAASGKDVDVNISGSDGYEYRATKSCGSPTVGGTIAAALTLGVFDPDKDSDLVIERKR